MQPTTESPNKVVNIIQHKKKKFVRPKLIKSESVASCKPAEGEFLKTHQQYTPANVGERTIHTHFSIETRPLQKNMLFGDDGKINIGLLRNHFFREGRLSIDCALELVRKAKKLLLEEENMITIEAPVIVCGDIHGQFYDLLTIFDITKPIENNKYVFLGDYVDRGDFGCEVLFFLMAHKINYPKQFFFLRGNHESKMMTESMTFNLECEYKYHSIELLNEIHELFDALPLAALVEGNSLGRFFCTHGGISPFLTRLSQYNEIKRVQEPPSRGPMCDILWSDPLEEPQHPETMEKRRLDAWLATDFADNHLRQTSVLYGPRGLLNFLEKNDLICVVRAHQVMEDGFKLHYFLQNTDIPPCITVFSAPNYCDMYQNKASILKINLENICFEQFEYVDHPFNFPDFFDCFSYSLPTMMEMLVNILSELVVAVKEEDESMLTPEERKSDEELKKKLELYKQKTTDKMKEKADVLRLKKEIKTTQKLNKEWFDKVLRIDSKNEMRPKRLTRKLTSRPANMRTVSDTNILH
ncbi:Ser/Thr protein phosphatase, putative [Entamoeba histolytica HM-1:IMSS-B]|uniref:Serine/threonine-protein phosphatase n=6 Tax=Entamoeba histolytica TaxID=5759 RepID=C4LWV7_ENTH1|nr:Ser/Thr protein phosphatase, putative [Entamoeba histolytica HM-1:IMSS]EMD43548.1 serine/threonine protein phosphatase catalytic subunit, putative [Entamoeba histolytica KU27]EMH74663.1 Ser/Thr protein phosphatase, putative [Entamoeba histolytica HM-1:IMSS-B]EMS16247.1 serine/threonine protein phosphatase 2B catalytic subunit, putative [Entamoeba histolytica HM-3:IMSS]ENY63207.1 serine/threonine protein phosphatase 2B catalytic subunit, putative [Entamoeba histolytica HM-1:IMSS-A]GAT93201.1|eukprot:XP_653295.1 Ser/Thr protein phosphatase, putative [Entamoeba histolytica HM-1:IMSS]